MKAMLFRIIILIFLTGFHPFIYSQDSGENTVFWKITGENLQKPSYLFGTMHIIPKDDFVSYKKADQILKDCDQLVLEMIIDVPLKQQMEWAKLMILPEGQEISDFTDEKEYTRIRSYAIDSLEVKEFLFNAYVKLKPFAFYSAMIPHAIGKKIEGYELHYSKIAKNKGIPVYGLESFEYQMGIFDSIPNNRQMEMFFGDELNLKNEMTEMLDMYFSHDIYAMANSISEESSEYKEFEDNLLHLRNVEWSIQLHELMQQESCFIAVGAAHLAGNSGMIKLLREKGYQLDPICLIPECN